MSANLNRLPVLGALAFSLVLVVLFAAAGIRNGYLFSPPVTSICGGTHALDTNGHMICTGGVPAP